MDARQRKSLEYTLDADTGALCEGSSDRCHQTEQVYLEYPKPEGSHYRFLWNDKFKMFDHFNATFGQVCGSYLSDAKKQQVLDAGLVPAFPEPH
ncbi:MAG TPA: hypothetical protein VKA82_13655 [Rubrobacter sp.]|nr:hypothetical protein [Rubrobacter sp.]